jgi:hypothetical protein
MQDHTIAGQVRGIQINNPFETLTRAKEQRYQNEQRDFQRQQQEHTLGALRRQDEGREAIAQAFAEAGGDGRKAATILRKDGRWLTEADEVENQWYDNTKQRFDYLKQQQETVQGIFANAGSMLSAITPPEGGRPQGIDTFDIVQEGKPGQGGTRDFGRQTIRDNPSWTRAQDAYAQARPIIVDMLNQVDPELAGQIPTDYDPDSVQEMILRGLSLSDRLKERDRLLAKAEEVVTQRQDAAKHETSLFPLVAGWLSTAETPEEIAEARTMAIEMGVRPTTFDFLSKRSPEELLTIYKGKQDTTKYERAGTMMVEVNGKLVPRAVSFDRETNSYFLPGNPMPVDVFPMPERATGGGGGTEAATSRLPPDLQNNLNDLINARETYAATKAWYLVNRGELQEAYPDLKDSDVESFLVGVYGPRSSAQRDKDEEAIRQDSGDVTDSDYRPSQMNRWRSLTPPAPGQAPPPANTPPPPKTGFGDRYRSAIERGYTLGQGAPQAGPPPPAPNTIGGLARPPQGPPPVGPQAPPRGAGPGPVAGGGPPPQAPPSPPPPAERPAQSPDIIKTIPGVDTKTMDQLMRSRNGAVHEFDTDDGRVVKFLRVSGGFVQLPVRD